MEIIRKRSYTPSATARNLSKRTSSTIGMIAPEVDNPFFGDILRGVTEVIDQNGMTLLCCNSDDSLLKDRRALEMLKEHRICGLLYTPAADYTEKEETVYKKLLGDLDAPVVLMDRPLACLNYLDGIYFNDCQGVYNATKALIQAGHRKIGIINGTLERVLARIRQNGYIAALTEAGILPEDRYMFFGDFRMTRSYYLAQELLSMPDRPTAVITCNNRTSMGFLKALNERGEQLQRDISCIGLDRIEALDIIGIEFNYIKRDALQMGKKAVELLLKRIAEPDLPVANITIEAPLILKKI